MKYKIFAIALLFMPFFGMSQEKHEQEFRIKKSQFPDAALEQIEQYLGDAKRIRFYQELDSTKKSYEAKFKKGRLHYSVEFNETGKLEDVEFIIKERDIPEDSWNAILEHLQENYPKFRIKKIQQQYPLADREPKKTLHEAFQNLILPYINYELVFSAKKDKGFQTYEALFNSEGTLINIRKSSPLSYDHVLYP
ncbi:MULTISPECIES: PepSY-like domain-containing protein [Flagellimonas]|uniref:Beta-lactamase-inhibitor-like PepSY-like domain-containing protein n=1 Tax=Flagellimonas hadalis TaxID=2597517 RepID=A0A5N5IPM8_9FLAO|nr:PepSY-like domain-containing protein [Allomuricauda hadalis]KAB5485094.1 hypothetical protein FOT42_015905 [Allomuricauda hadalis]